MVVAVYFYVVTGHHFMGGAELLRILITNEGQNDFVLVIWGFIALFLYYLSYQAYGNPNLFDTLPERVLENNNLKNTQDHKCSVKNSNIINELMAENKFFLDHDLTIHQFATEINMSPRLISSCVN